MESSSGEINPRHVNEPNSPRRRGRDGDHESNDGTNHPQLQRQRTGLITGATAGTTNDAAIQNLGRAAATIEVDRNAMLHLDNYIQANQEAFRNYESILEYFKSGEIEDSEVIGEELKVLLLDYSEYLMGEVLATKDPFKPLKSSTKIIYFGKAKEYFKVNLPSLQIWEGHDEKGNGWYSNIRDKFAKQGLRNFINDDESTPDQRCRPLVIRCTETDLRQDQRFWIPLQGADLESIIKQLLQSNDIAKFELRAQLVISSLAAGRGGEIKFLRWRDILWDYLFSTIQVFWTRMKTTVKQLLYFQCYRDGWLCDIYHTLGCWFHL